jgi:hypothetical protein
MAAYEYWFAYSFAKTSDCNFCNGGLRWAVKAMLQQPENENRLATCLPHAQRN